MPHKVVYFGGERWPVEVNVFDLSQLVGAELAVDDRLLC
jgi:hypothetical protein